MKSLIIKLLTGKGARIKVALTAGLVSLITWALTKFGLEISEDWRPQIIVGATFAAGYALEAVAAWLGVKGILAIQDQIPWVTSSGRVTENGATVTAVKQLVEDAGNPPRPDAPTVLITRR